MSVEGEENSFQIGADSDKLDGSPNFHKQKPFNVYNNSKSGSLVSPLNNIIKKEEEEEEEPSISSDDLNKSLISHRISALEQTNSLLIRADQGNDSDVDRITDLMASKRVDITKSGNVAHGCETLGPLSDDMLLETLQKQQHPGNEFEDIFGLSLKPRLASTSEDYSSLDSIDDSFWDIAGPEGVVTKTENLFNDEESATFKSNTLGLSLAQNENVEEKAVEQQSREPLASSSFGSLSVESIRKQLLQTRTESTVMGGWCYEEDVNLRDLIRSLGSSRWNTISEFLPGRSARACQSRWREILAARGLKRGAWGAIEDKRLVFACDRDNQSWTEIAFAIPGRTAKQCRERWSLYLDPSIRKGPWRIEEDRLILEKQRELGNKWATIAAMLPGRTETSVKSRFKSIARAAKKMWTPKEDSLIMHLYEVMGSQWGKIAESLPGRTRNAVKVRFRQLSSGNYVSESVIAGAPSQVFIPQTRRPKPDGSGDYRLSTNERIFSDNLDIENHHIQPINRLHEPSTPHGMSHATEITNQLAKNKDFEGNPIQDNKPYDDFSFNRFKPEMPIGASNISRFNKRLLKREREYELFNTSEYFMEHPPYLLQGTGIIDVEKWYYEPPLIRGFPLKRQSSSQHSSENPLYGQYY